MTTQDTSCTSFLSATRIVLFASCLCQTSMDITPAMNISKSCVVCPTFVAGLHTLHADKKKVSFEWTFNDRLPSFSNLTAAARGGCAWCELLDRIINPVRDAVPVDRSGKETVIVFQIKALKSHDPDHPGHLRGATELILGETSLLRRHQPRAFTIHVLFSEDFNPFSPANLDSLRPALSECLHKHRDCPSSVEGTAPTRLLNVNMGDEVRLERIRGTAVKYAALSYCWGVATSDAGKDYRTLWQNIDAREKAGFELKELPKTLRDAVLITRRLKIPYLWIDALCIIQDDEADWETESVQMMHYYGNAYLTIVPVESDSVNTGFEHDPKHRPFVRTFPGPWNHEGTTTGSDLMLADAGSRYYNGTIWRTTWNRRGWTFQEMAISARILFVFNNNLTFMCRTSAWDSLKRNQRGSSHRAPTFLPHYPRKGEEESARNLWSQLVNNYTWRRLTKLSDRWVAFSGIAQRFSSTFQQEIVAGLLKKRLVEELVSWAPPVPLPMPPHTLANGDETSFPSWTWLNADWTDKDWGIIAYTTPVKNFLEHPRAEIHSILNQHDVRSTKLEVHSSVIDQESILDLLLPQAKRRYPREVLPALGGDKLRFDHCRCSSNPHPEEQGKLCELVSHAVISSLGPAWVSALFIGIGTTASFPDSYDWYFLIIQPTAEDKSEPREEYRRIGLMAIEDDEMEKEHKVIKDRLVKGENRRTILLV